MKNRLILILPALLMLYAFSDVTVANATTAETSSEIVILAEEDSTLIESALESTITEIPPPETNDSEIPVTELIAPETSTTEATAQEATIPEAPVSETPPPEIPAAEVIAPETSIASTTVQETTVPEAIPTGETVTEVTTPEPTTPDVTILETPVTETTTKVALPEEADLLSEPTEEWTTEETEMFASTISTDTFAAALAIETTGPSELVTKVTTDEKVVSLTISDITNQTNLNAILNNLGALGIKATFFVDSTADPDYIDQIAAAGHEIGNQSYQHIDTTQLTSDELAAEVNAMDDIIQENAGTSSKPYFRAPYGITNASILETVGSLGYAYTIGWTTDTRDWTGTLSASQISTNVINSLVPGAIYLFHANALASTTPAALLSIITSAISSGYQFETIGGLLSLDVVVPELPADEPSELITKVDTGQKVVSLTISDVTSETNLDAILTNLDSLGVKATFFVDGTANPDFIDQIVAAGHEIGNQSYQHVNTTQMTPTALASEIKQMDSIIQDATGVSSRPYFRAPYGITNSSVLNTAGSLGYAYTIGWTTDTRDWTGTLTASQISANVLNSLTPGAIYLLHANALAANTPAALLSIVSSAYSNGYDFATISELIALKGIIEPEIPVSTVSQLIDQVDTDKKVIALTFDDGDSDEYLSDILYNLNYLGIKATFFLNGWANADLMAQLVTDGHQLGNHGYSHDDSTAITSDKLVTEVNMMEDYIVSATGTSSLPFFRAPHGLYNDSVLETVGSLGYKYTIGWSIDTIDWTGNSESEISDTILENVHPGAIVLMHANTGAVNTAESLWYTIAALQEAGYSFTTVEDLLLLGGYEWKEPVVTPPSQVPSQLITQVNTDNQVISLTISDASSSENLRQILANLEGLDVKATFFLNGETDPSLIDDIIAQGHEIGNHTYSHTDATDLTAAQLKTELNAMEDIIQEASGTSSKPYFRAPMGATNSAILDTVGSLGYQYTIGWTTDTRDWTGTLTASQISANVVNSLTPGAIYLLHGNSSAASTPAALLQIVSQVRALGYEFKTISGLLDYEDVYTGELDEEVWTEPSLFIDHVDTAQKVIALTFDDGDDYDNLHDVLWNLNSLDVKATFFLNGATDTDLLRQVVTDGHQLANHTYSHYDYSTELSPGELAYDIELMEDYIVSTTGVTSRPYFRAPSGDYDDSVLETVGSLGYKYTIGWTQDTRDWTGLSETEVADSVIDYLSAGSIYLLHANPTAVGTPESLWYLVSEARDQGYEFVTIEELLALQN